MGYVSSEFSRVSYPRSLDRNYAAAALSQWLQLDLKEDGIRASIKRNNPTKQCILRMQVRLFARQRKVRHPVRHDKRRRLRDTVLLQYLVAFDEFGYSLGQIVL